MNQKALSDGELDVMLAVWQAGEPTNSAYIQNTLQGKRDWQLPALLTVLSRLTDKGYLLCEKQGRGNLYTALVTKETYQSQESKGLLEKFYRGSLTALTASLVKNGAVSEEELMELRNFLEKQEADDV